METARTPFLGVECKALSGMDKNGFEETTSMSEIGELEVRNTLFCMDETGDNRIQWRKDRPDEVASARARFNELKRRGFLAYKVSGRDRGDVIDEFDPDEERIIMAPQMVGG